MEFHHKRPNGCIRSVSEILFQLLCGKLLCTILSVKIPVVPSRITSPSAYSPLRPDTHSKFRCKAVGTDVFSGFLWGEPLAAVHFVVDMQRLCGSDESRKVAHQRVGRLKNLVRLNRRCSTSTPVSSRTSRTTACSSASPRFTYPATRI